MVGLQASGKTTFAAALWHLVDSREVPTALKKGRHEGDFKYLEEIAATWAEGYTQGRTHSETAEEIRINLLHEGSATEICLQFSDIAGESYEAVFATRQCGEEFLSLVNRAEGILLFVSAQRKADDTTLLDAAQVMSSATESPASEADSEVEAQPDWDPAKTPQQMQLVDLLTSFRSHPFHKSTRKVAVVISAWDLSRTADPTKWLKDKMPLLHQYLTAAENGYGWTVYGVSAQGGELNGRDAAREGKDRAKLLGLPTASERIRVVGGDGLPHDLTQPILWLSGLAG